MKLAKTLLPCLLVLACSSAQARADCNALGLAYLYGYGGFQNNVGLRPFVASPPYFSLYPPVYYGQRFSRPYGVSPFATWPQLGSNPAYAPRRQASRAQTWSNPHFHPTGAVSSPGNQVVKSQPIQPLEIENPYFQAEPVQYTSKASDDR